MLKAPEFGHYREIDALAAARPRPTTPGEEPGTAAGWHAHRLRARQGSAKCCCWVAAGGAVAYALWWPARMLPRCARAAAPSPTGRPPALFGMELAPEKLPADVGAAAAALAREGKLREALSLLYRGALSELVHKRGVRAAREPYRRAKRVTARASMPYFAVAGRRLAPLRLRAAHARSRPRSSSLAADYKAALA